MTTRLEKALEKAKRGEPLSREEEALLSESEARWDDLKDAQRGEQSALEEEAPPGAPTHVHQEAGLVQVLKRAKGSWLYRAEGGIGVDRAEKGEFRELLSAKEAAAVLKRLGAIRASKMSSDADRRAHLRKKPSFLDVKALERELTYFIGLAAAGATLWTMEKVPFQRVRQHLAAELSLSLGRPVDLPDL